MNRPAAREAGDRSRRAADHGKTTLNYATFEAARAGATRHAQPDPMRRELGIRLAPLFGGDGSETKAAEAIARSIIAVDAPVNLDLASVGLPAKLEILNPTEEAFAAWSAPSLETENTEEAFAAWSAPSLETENIEAIPNSHLAHQGGDTKAGVTLQDANLLKIKVTYPFELKIPLISGVLTQALGAVSRNPDHAVFYAANRLPLESVATVRMQSEVWGESLKTAGAAPFGGTAEEPVDPLAAAPADEQGQEGDPNEDDELAGDGTDGMCTDENGLPLSTPIQVSDNGQCGPTTDTTTTDTTTAGREPLFGGPDDDTPQSSPVCS